MEHNLVMFIFLFLKLTIMKQVGTSLLMGTNSIDFKL